MRGDMPQSVAAEETSASVGETDANFSCLYIDHKEEVG